MSTPTNEELGLRLERLERACNNLSLANRRWKRLFVTALVGVLAISLAGADDGKLIDAQKITLRDQAGKVRASLEVKETGEPSLQFFDEDGNRGIELKIDQQVGSVLALDWAPAKTSVALMANRFGASHVIVSVKGGHEATLLAVAGGDDSGAELTLGPEDGPDRLTVKATEEGGWMRIEAGDPKLERALTLSAGKDGSADLVLGDKDQERRLAVGGEKDGSPYVKLIDANGKPLLEIPKP